MKIIQKPPCSEDKLMNKVINEQTEIKDWEEGKQTLDFTNQFIRNTTDCQVICPSTCVLIRKDWQSLVC